METAETDDKVQPGLNQVPETMLWTLHNRASEALRPDGILVDQKALAIYRSLDYDYEKAFGAADGSHAQRSLIFDKELRAFLDEAPNGVIINLGEGLETQRYRLDSPESLWVTVDLPDGIAIRERFIQPDERHWHIPASALDESWMDKVPEGRPVYITAQGLLMYFTPGEVEQFIKTLARRFPGAWLTFDHIPQVLSKRSMKGWKKTAHYTTPKMPWGVDMDDLKLKLKAWVPNVQQLESIRFTMPRGPWRVLGPVFLSIPFLRKLAPGITRVRFPSHKKNS